MGDGNGADNDCGWCGGFVMTDCAGWERCANCSREPNYPARPPTPDEQDPPLALRERMIYPLGDESDYDERDK